VTHPSRRGIDIYRTTDAQTRSPVELVVLLYDGALRYAGEAKTAIARGDIAARRDAISRTLAIVSELQSTLDMERGGAIARSLDGLYTFLTSRLLDAGIRPAADTLDEVIRVLTPLRDAWADVAARSAETAPRSAA
jgi:flagellar protein FliS